MDQERDQEPASDTGESKEPDQSSAMEEAQKEAAEERKEGGYQ